MPPKLIPFLFLTAIFLYIVALTLDSMRHTEQPQKSSQQLLDEMRARQEILKLIQ